MGSSLVFAWQPYVTHIMLPTCLCTWLHCGVDFCHAAAREVQSNHERMVLDGKPLTENRFWRMVMDNAPWAAYNAYKLTLYGLVRMVAAEYALECHNGGLMRACTVLHVLATHGLSVVLL